MSADSSLYHAAAAPQYTRSLFVDALATLKPLLSSLTSNVEALNLAAICCFRLNRLDEAEAHWRRAITVDPAYTGGYGNLGNLLMAKGDLSGAEAVYRRAIEHQPDFAQAHYNLGNLLSQTGRRNEAQAALRRAIDIQPDFAEAHNNLGNLLRDDGRIAEAEAAYLGAIDARPDYVDAHRNLASLLRSDGRTREARIVLRRARAALPDSAEILCSLGDLLREQGNPARAVVCFRRAVTLRPDSIDAQCGLGYTLLASDEVEQARLAFDAAISVDANSVNAQTGLAQTLEREDKLDDAGRAWRRAIAMEPGNAEAHGSLATVLHGLGELSGAEAACRNALSIRPHFPEVLYNLGVILTEQNRLPEAAKEFEQAITLRPDYVAPRVSLGRLLRDLGRLSDAEAILREALALNADVTGAHTNVAGVLKDMGRMDEAMEHFYRAVDCDPQDVRAHCNLNYALTYHAEDPRDILDSCLRFAARHETPWLSQAPAYGNARDPERRLRIGYVAPDFNAHCQSMFTAPVFARHDHANYEIFCYSSSIHDDITAKIRPTTYVWRDVQTLSDERLAQVIRDDGIDVLVDLTLHMSRARPLLFARRPAPVQVQWLGYPGTTGSSAIRYRLSDPWIDPPDRPEFEAFYSERTLRLPETFWCYDVRATSPDVGPLPAHRNGHITFGCLNNPCKASPRTLRIWARVLDAVPDSRLILLANDGPRERYLEELSALGVEPSRIEFVGYQARDT
ncbi:TPR domain protein, putative component of TonB system [Candidatus Burkholderia verschuerenii]|uniref:protein O-GlcNAc transferase n=1 Tax=Candidatus Burkholderia verschuerenii TaxID=242163 RepID=A0A0L0M8J8_9BURK|nr:tetratricopeptide repeat protein [Candidatus Burkholderia verschuerenii]KND58688.1 TPR domain protein, putative component of TonB system [Candidatus Burkholderia verschuerenii]